MPSFSFFGALLAITASLSVPVPAQTAPPANPSEASNRTTRKATTSAAAGRVQHVVVRGTGDALEVEIQTSGASISPDTQVITGPDRIVVDFPGALPAAELRALKVNRGVLKGVRSGLFFNNPPITRVVLDLAKPEAYQISTAPNLVIVKLSPAKLAPATSASANPESTAARLAQASERQSAPGARFQNAALATESNDARPNIATVNVAPGNIAPRSIGPGSIGQTNISPVNRAHRNTAIASVVPNPVAMPLHSAAEPSPAPQPPLTVTFVNGMLSIAADKATLAQVLFEVHRQTNADIAIPAGAEQEQVVANLGPAPARDVLSSLLNGSPYNFIFVGNENRLEQVILTLRDPNLF
ncbi:MAG: AMIN domain-containing protein [Terriglobales bacterium]